MAERRPDEGLIEIFMRLVDEVFEHNNFHPPKPTQEVATTMWIEQDFRIGNLRVGLLDSSVRIVEVTCPDDGPNNTIEIHPQNEDEAAMFSIAFKKAARRFEEIGKGMR